MQTTPSCGWIPTFSGSPLSGPPVECLLAGGKTILALQDPDQNRLLHHDGTGPVEEPVYAWRYATPGVNQVQGLFLQEQSVCPLPWFPVATADRLADEAVVEVLCHNGDVGAARYLTPFPLSDGEPAIGPGTFVWLESDGPDDPSPEVAFWRFRAVWESPADVSAVSIHPTVRRNHPLLRDLLADPLELNLPASAADPSAPVPCPEVLLSVKPLQPGLLLLELWAVLNDFYTFSQDLPRLQLVEYWHGRLRAVVLPHLEALDSLVTNRRREGE